MRASACAALLMLFSAPALEAQGPWTVSLRPGKNPIPIGQCTQVLFKAIDPVTKGTPRTALGHYVSNLGDFDMEVQSAGNPAVVGKYETSSIWAACACQSAAIGQQAVITATYPGKSVPAALRVPGVAFKTQVSFTISAAESKFDPPGCEALKPAATTRGVLPAAGTTTGGTTTAGTTATGTTTTGTTTAGTTTSGTATSGTTTAATTTSGTTTSGTTTSGTTTSGTTTASAPVVGPTVASGRTTSPPLAPQPGPAPTAKTSAILNKRAGVSPAGKGPPIDVTVTGTITGVRVSFNSGDAGWTLVAQMLYRKDGAQLSTSRGKSGASCDEYSTTGCIRYYLDDVLTDNSVSYVFTVVNVYEDGTRAESAPAPWTFPPLVNPSAFSASDQGAGTVKFKWQPTAGAVRYRLDGPGVPDSGVMISDTTTTVKAVPGGRHTWKLEAMYPANFADYANPSLATELVRVMPPHPIPWLSKKNGPGSDAIAEAHFANVCTRQRDDGVKVDWSCPVVLMQELKRVPGALNFSDQPIFQAVYGNPTDLGFGRRTSCAEGLAPPPGFMTTICWATSHGPGAGEPGFADPDVITKAADKGDLFRTTTMIIKDATGMRFLVFGPPNGGGGYGDEKSAPSHYILLDTQGQKFAPHTCMSCHGGAYDSVSNRVIGATLMPLNPSELVFVGGPSGRAVQEESIRKINNYVLRAAPSAAVAAYINGLYGGKASVPGTRAIDDYIPSGWSTQAGLYRQVVRPYCATCHMAANPAYSFSSWANFDGNAALINAAVCATHSMPHAEQPFKEFWTKKTGIVYLPGLLAASLGFPSC